MHFSGKWAECPYFEFPGATGLNRLCLRGITWNHSRAFPPLVAAAQRYAELHSHVRIEWEKRSLDDFGHAGLAQLSGSYDLLVVDHPMLGDAHRDRSLVDMRPHLKSAELAALEEDALGACFESYRYEDTLYALPLDAAAPAASYRADLLERSGHQVPSTWDQVIELARRGLVRMPGFPADLFLNFMGMCVSRGSSVAFGDRLLDHAVATRCLEELRELASYMPETIYTMNPIGLYEAMAASDEFAYCPFAYTYSNYSRLGFAAHPLLFANPVSLRGGSSLRTVLGGTGIAVSATCAEMEEALAFCLFVTGRDCQCHLYGICGGQPASNAAWRNSLLNRISGEFFERTLSSIESAYVRPRYPGYVTLQKTAGIPIASFLRGESSAGQTLESLDNLYRQSLTGAQSEQKAAQ
jgi:multiple sugar transport system substrate-binding protein